MNRSHPAYSVLALWITLVLALGAGTAILDLRADDGPPHPDDWDPRVVDIAAFDEKARHLDFDHPVYVDFLTPEQYTKLSRTDESSLDADTRRYYDDLAARYRALGLAGGELDIFGATNDTNDSGTLAFYSPFTKRVYVRGTTLTPGLRVTIAHELVHALQDQNFDLTKYTKAPSASAATAYRALLEGDAVYVENEYVAQELSAAERKAYRAEQQRSFEESVTGLTNVPDALVTFFNAPYALGIPFVDLMNSVGETQAVDDALNDPPLSDEYLFDPATLIGERTDPDSGADGPLDLREPKGTKLLSRGDFGLVSWYVMLGARIPAADALAAVRGWGNDGQVAYRKDGALCLDIVFEGDESGDVVEMADALRAWAKTLPKGMAKVDTTSRSRTKVSTCDPGVKAKLGIGDRAGKALKFASLRSYLLSALVQQGLAFHASSCAADAVLAAAGFDAMVKADEKYFRSDGYQKILKRSVDGCR